MIIIASVIAVIAAIIAAYKLTDHPAAKAVIIASVVLWLLFLPQINAYANGFRITPGIGGELFLPLYPVLGVCVWNHRHDFK